MLARLREARFPVHVFALLLALSLMACESEPKEPPEPDKSDESGEARESSSSPAPGIKVAGALGASDEEADFSTTQQAADLLDAAHAVFMHSARSRDSEMGHEAYRPELLDGPMEAHARLWLQLVEALQSRHAEGTALRPTASWDGEQWTASGEPDLADYASGVYLYHMHHREGWFEDEALRDSITRYPLGLITGMSRHVYDGFYEDGAFHSGGEQGRVSQESMMQGLAASHAMAYAWLRWSKPGGSEDMGSLSEDQLRAWLGRGPDDLLRKAREKAGVLDAAWDETRGFYDFGQDEMDLKTLGALLRGHKGLAETLHVFGESADQAQAVVLFQRATGLLSGVMDLSQDWGLPVRVRFTEQGVEAASEHVDVAQHWDLISQLTAGFSFTREREGTAQLLAREHESFSDTLGQWIDEQIEGALNHQMPDGLLVTVLDYESGELRDEGHSLSAISRFMLGAGEGYGSGDRFASPDDWQDSEALENRSRDLYEALARHGEWLTTRLIKNEN